MKAEIIEQLVRVEVMYRNMATDLLTMVTNQIKQMLDKIGDQEMIPELKELESMERECDNLIQQKANLELELLDFEKK